MGIRIVGGSGLRGSSEREGMPEMNVPEECEGQREQIESG